MHAKLDEIAQLINDYRTLLLERVNPLSQSQLDWRATQDDWSIGEVLDHLYLVETGSSKVLYKYATELKDKNFSAPPLDGSALTSLDHFQVETIQTKRKAPEAVVPRSGVTKAELLAQLEGCRARLLQTIDALDAYDLHQFHFPHPVFGKIDLYQWIIFIGKHERRHITQVENILAHTDFPATTPASEATAA
ncbi:MAG: DinB family protein [Pyrinomonadaceae bacterium MAG19_C2-C3]|nr:DinB family protein [Pyrinomonadaceae bacterium MAG19_C2-C3]